MTTVPTEATLSPAQERVLRLVAKGMTNDQVAAELGITSNTARAHLGWAMSKLRCHTRIAAARWWWEREHGETERLLRELVVAGCITVFHGTGIKSSELAGSLDNLETALTAASAHLSQEAPDA